MFDAGYTLITEVLCRCIDKLIRFGRNLFADDCFGKTSDAKLGLINPKIQIVLSTFTSMFILLLGLNLNTRSSSTPVISRALTVTCGSSVFSPTYPALNVILMSIPSAFCMCHWTVHKCLFVNENVA